MIPSSKVMFYLIIFLEPCLAFKGIDFEDIPNQWKNNLWLQHTSTRDITSYQIFIKSRCQLPNFTEILLTIVESLSSLFLCLQVALPKARHGPRRKPLQHEVTMNDTMTPLNDPRWPQNPEGHQIRNIHIKIYIYIYIDALFKYIRYYVNHYKSLIKDTRRISSQKAGILKTQNVLPFEAQARPCHLANIQLTPVYHPKAKKI